MSVSASPMNHTTEQRHLPRNESTLASIFKKMNTNTKRRRRSRRPVAEEQPRLQFMNVTHPEEAKNPSFMRTVRQRVMWNVADRREKESKERGGDYLSPQDAHSRDQQHHSSPSHSTSPSRDSGFGQSPGISDSGISAGASTSTEPVQDFNNDDWQNTFVRGPFQGLPASNFEMPATTQPAGDAEAHSNAIKAVDPYAEDVDEVVDRDDDSPNALVRHRNLDKLLKNSAEHIDLFNWDRLQQEPYINHFRWLANWSKKEPAKDLLGALDSPSLTAALSHGTQDIKKPPHTVISSIFLKALHLDIAHKESREGNDSLLLKTNVLHDVASRIKRDERATDATILSIIHLLGYELIIGEEHSLVMHEMGLTRAVHQRGGIEGLRSNRAMGTSIAAMIFMSSIFREAQPDPLYLHFVDSEYPYDSSWFLETPSPERESYPLFMHPVYGEYWSLLDSLWHNEDPAPHPFNIPKRTAPFKILESPVYCPDNGFHVIQDLCSRQTYNVLLEMRHMTDEFLSFHQASQPSGFRQPTPNPNWKMHAVLERIQSLPPAAQVSSYNSYANYSIDVGTNPPYTIYNTTTTNPNDVDWIYEAVRLTALLYAYALYHRIPLSEARKRLEITHPYPIPEAISLAIRNQGVCDMWGELGGVRLWCCFIAGAAAKQASGESGESAEDKKRALAREWLALGAVRCSIILAFYSARSVMGGLRRLLKVQELLGMPQAAMGVMNWSATTAV